MKQNIKIAKELVKLAKTLIALQVQYVEDLQKNKINTGEQLCFYDEKNKKIYFLYADGSIQWIPSETEEDTKPERLSTHKKTIDYILSLPKIEEWDNDSDLYNVPEKMIQQHGYKTEDFFNYKNNFYENLNPQSFHARYDHINRKIIKDIIEKNSNIKEQIQFIGYDIRRKVCYIIYNTAWCDIYSPSSTTVITGYFLTANQKERILQLPKFIKFIPYNLEQKDCFVICQKQHNTQLSSTFNKMFDFIQEHKLNNGEKLDEMSLSDLDKLKTIFQQFCEQNNIKKESSKFNKKIFTAKKLIELAKTLIC